MNKEQEAAWAEAQNIAIGEDLIAATQRQLEFLAAVDRQRWLYDSPGLERAIYRYKTFWLPLLANQVELQVQAPLAIPLDCEWIWHCHRLNPVQYKKDCERAFGKILDNKNVISSTQIKPGNDSEGIWTKIYPTEPFELKFNSLDKIPDIKSDESSQITYDLVSASKRQSEFYYQVSTPDMKDSRVLKSALERYKGMLYLIKINNEKDPKSFCVPTYDMDIMWHSHQLSPVSYCNDLKNLIGDVLGHDDHDSDRSKGQTLDLGFSKMTEQFEKVFGLRYWKAGVMYRGPLPTDLKSVPVLEESYKNILPLEKSSRNFLSLPTTKIVKVFLEVVEVKDAQINENEMLYVSFTKKQQDIFINGDHPLGIFSSSKEKDVASFDCEPTGELILTLIAKSPNPNSNSNITTNSKWERVIGTTSISLEELTDPKSNLSMQTWLEVKSKNCIFNPNPVYMHVATSCTVPVQAPVLLNMVKYDDSYLNSIYRKDNQNNVYRFVDSFGNEAIRLQMSDNENGLKKVFGIIANSGKKLLLAEGNENKWFLNQNSYNFSCTAEIKANQDGTYICELENNQMVKLYRGRRLEYEENCYNGHNDEGNFITAVEFSNENPYGKAIALLDLKAKLIKVNEDWFAMPCITLSFILVDLLDKQKKIINEPISLTKIDESMIKDKITTNPALASELTKNTTGGSGAAGIVSHKGTDGTGTVPMPPITSFMCCGCMCVMPNNNKGR